MSKLQRRIWIANKFKSFLVGLNILCQFWNTFYLEKNKQIQRQNVDCIEPRNKLLVGNFKIRLCYFLALINTYSKSKNNSHQQEDWSMLVSSKEPKSIVLLHCCSWIPTNALTIWETWGFAEGGEVSHP